MKRGEIWTVAGGKDYAGKPRPAVVVRDDAFAGSDSVTICGFTTDPTDSSLSRIEVVPTSDNGLREASSVMVEKIVTVPVSKVGKRIGRLDEADMARLDQALIVYLGLAARAGRAR